MVSIYRVLLVCPVVFVWCFFCVPCAVCALYIVRVPCAVYVLTIPYVVVQHETVVYYLISTVVALHTYQTHFCSQF